MTKETWITAGTAAKILEERFGRPIRVDYVTRLGSLGRLRKQDIGSRIVLYHRHDVEQIQIRERKKPSRNEVTQTQLPIAHDVASPSVEEKPIVESSQPINPQIFISERPGDIPPGTMKRDDFVKAYKLPNDKFTKWLENGLGNDRLEVTYYISFPNKKKSAAFTPEQLAHNLEVLRKHGKISDSGSAE